MSTSLKMFLGGAALGLIGLVTVSSYKSGNWVWFWTDIVCGGIVATWLILNLRDQHGT